MPVIQCPECQKKLKLKALKEGAKVKCPGCAKIFRPTAADAQATSASTKTSKPSKARPTTSGKSPAAKPTKRRPAKKKRPAPVDDFDDFGDDDFGDDDYGDGDDFGAPPARRPRSGGKKAAKKKPVEAKSKKPLVIGLAVIAIAAIGGGAFWLLGGGSDEGGSDTNIADTNNDNAGEDEDASHAASNDTGQAKPDQSAASSAQAGSNNGGSSGNGTTASANVGTFSSESSPVDLKWMPASTEGLIHIRVPELMKGPLGALVNLPQLAPQIEQFKAMAGMEPNNIQSITVGVSRISEMSQLEQEPNPESMSLIAIVRADQTMDASKIMLMNPEAKQVTEGSLTYYKIPEDPPVAIWMPDGQTAVVGAESVVQQVATQDGSTSNLDTGLLNGQSSIEIAFSPAIPDAIFRHSNFRIPDGGPTPVPPPIRTLVAAMKEHTVGASIGITLTEDLGFNTAFRSRDAAGAAKFQQTFQSVMEELKNMPPPSADGQGIPPMLAGFMAPLEKIGEDMNESLEVITSGTLTKTAMKAKGGGQTLSGFVPMASMLLLPAIQAGRSAAQATQGRNNMKQIGLAMHNFHDVYGRFPNAVGIGPNGEKWLSWRVHLLPFLGYEELYNQFALEEPWDSPRNRPLADLMPNVFSSPNANTEVGKTVYMVPVGAGTAFEDQKGRRFRDILDGTSNSIMMVEVEASRAVYWTEPVDYSVNTSNPFEGLARRDGSMIPILFCDGSTQNISADLDSQTANHMFTISDGAIINFR
ncbi:MAG: DUF1559 domain-containing protein [Fuerstiella sp.]